MHFDADKDGTIYVKSNYSEEFQYFTAEKKVFSHIHGQVAVEDNVLNALKVLKIVVSDGNVAK